MSPIINLKLVGFDFSIKMLCSTEYIFTILHVVNYRIDITLVYYSAVWSCFFCPSWFGRTVQYAHYISIRSLFESFLTLIFLQTTIKILKSSTIIFWVLYILTSNWVLRTPNTGWNMFFIVFHVKSWKGRKNKKIEANFAKTGFLSLHPNTGQVHFSYCLD